MINTREFVRSASANRIRRSDLYDIQISSLAHDTRIRQADDFVFLTHCRTHRATRRRRVHVIVYLTWSYHSFVLSINIEKLPSIDEVLSFLFCATILLQELNTNEPSKTWLMLSFSTDQNEPTLCHPFCQSSLCRPRSAIVSKTLFYTQR